MSSLGFTNKTITEILNKYQTIWALRHVSNLSEWDLETYMPEKGAKSRGLALAKIDVLTQSLFLKQEFLDLIKKAKDEELNDYEKGVLRMLEREIKVYSKLPSSFIEEYEKEINEAQVIWRKARKESTYEMFSNNLGKIIELNLQKADYLGYDEHPYNALLDLYEESLTVSDLETFFSDIKPFLKDLLSKVITKNSYTSNHELLTKSYDINKAKELSFNILKLLRYDTQKLRLDQSTHPFTQGMVTNEDVRITTRFEGTNIASSISSTIHEYGHALYELQVNDSLNYTPIGQPSSLGVHESQSRFWENIIGRSFEFINLILPAFKDLGKNYESFDAKSIYEYFNLIKPGLIRVEADEITYHFHIMIRYEIEKALLSKEITISEVKEYWNNKYFEYLGIKPDSDATGVLQDIHWSMGSVGYFPTYSTGTVLSATWKHFLEKEIGSISDILSEESGIIKIQSWLKENVHQFGSAYTFKELVKKVTGEEFTSKYWKEYMLKKYS